MGNCCGKDAQAGPAPKNNLKSNKTRRQNTWEATGVVSLRDASAKEFPAVLEAIAGSIRVVDATNNRISHLPGYLASFTALQRLVLSRNALTSLPPDLGALSNLKVLSLDSNQLTSLPDCLGQLARLERLTVAGNSLAALPASLGSLRTLRQLDVSGNKLMLLPAELGECAALEELNAEDNYLQAIPGSLGHLQLLKSLALDNNRIKAIPPAVLSDCSSLQKLSLHGNPITMQEVEETEGYAAFEQRRKSKFDKSIGAGVLLDSKGLDEGVDRRRK